MKKPLKTHGLVFMPVIIHRFRIFVYVFTYFFLKCTAKQGILTLDVEVRGPSIILRAGRGAVDRGKDGFGAFAGMTKGEVAASLPLGR